MNEYEVRKIIREELAMIRSIDDLRGRKSVYEKEIEFINSKLSMFGQNQDDNMYKFQRRKEILLEDIERLQKAIQYEMLNMQLIFYKAELAAISEDE